MKIFVVLAAVLACAAAKPGLIAQPALGYGLGLGYNGYAGYGYAAPAYYHAAPQIIAPAVTATQYHAQDELGQSSHGYAHPGQAKAEVRDAFGNVRGSYAYVDANGKEVRVNYVADAINGFRVESNNLPVAPTAEDVPALVAPVPVQETPEVAEARAAHVQAHAAAAAAAAAAPETESRKKRGLAYTYPSLAAPALTYAAHPYAAYGYGYTAYAGAPALTYAAAPVAVAAPAVTYAAAPALREATLTKIVNNPGHAVSYRVD